MIKFNVGCGKRNWAGWVSIDGGNYDHVTDHDITLKYQPNNYIDLLYSSHLIAYMSRQEIKEILSIWFMKIKPGGTLRIATPDFDILSKMYQVGVDLDRLIGPLFGHMSMNESSIWHKITYDEKTLTALLTEAGFTNVRRYNHCTTEHPNTGDLEDYYDDHSAAYLNGTLISLNMESQKP